MLIWNFIFVFGRKNKKRKVKTYRKKILAAKNFAVFNERLVKRRNVDAVLAQKRIERPKKFAGAVVFEP